MKAYVSMFGIVLAVLLGVSTVALGQSNCPKVTVSCPDSVYASESLTFTVGVSGGDSNVTPTFNWTVSAGTISSGQGTSTIQIDMTGLGKTTVTATVDVGGFDRSCSTSASCTSSVPVKLESRKLDEYPEPIVKPEDARLDKFAIELQTDPTASAYIIAYGGRRGRASEAQKAADAAKSYLSTKRGIDAGRIVTVDGGYRESVTLELWIVPAGATPPPPSPTVDPKDVQLDKPAVKGRPKRNRRAN